MEKKFRLHRLGHNTNEVFQASISNESLRESLAEFKENTSLAKMDDVLVFLIECYKSIPHILEMFWSKTSDSCPLDETEMLAQVKEFQQWAYRTFFLSEQHYEIEMVKKNMPHSEQSAQVSDTTMSNQGTES